MRPFGDDSPKINHDSQGSGEQWGRDEIYPDRRCLQMDTMLKQGLWTPWRALFHATILAWRNVINPHKPPRKMVSITPRNGGSGCFWLVVDLPIWKIWFRQWEGLLFPYMKWKIKVMFETTNQAYIHIYIPHLNQPFSND